MISIQGYRKGTELLEQGSEALVLCGPTFLENVSWQHCWSKSGKLNILISVPGEKHVPIISDYNFALLCSVTELFPIIYFIISERLHCVL